MNEGPHPDHDGGEDRAAAPKRQPSPEAEKVEQHELAVEEREAFEYWDYLFKPDKTGTDRLKSLLRGLKDVINEHYEPSDNPDLTPTQLAQFYRDLHGNYDQLFLSTPSESIAFIYKSLGCLHSLQPQSFAHSTAFADPTVPALKTEGWIMWQTIQLLLGPAEHSEFLREAVRRWDVKDPTTGNVFPKILPRQCFPLEPDRHMVAWYEGVSERLRREAEEEERVRELEAEQAETRRIRDKHAKEDAEDAESVGSKGPALAYFRNPLYRHVDGRPSIVRSSSKRPGMSPRPTMRDKAKDGASTMGGAEVYQTISILIMVLICPKTKRPLAALVQASTVHTGIGAMPADLIIHIPDRERQVVLTMNGPGLQMTQKHLDTLAQLRLMTLALIAIRIIAIVSQLNRPSDILRVMSQHQLAASKEKDRIILAPRQDTMIVDGALLTMLPHHLQMQREARVSSDRVQVHCLPHMLPVSPNRRLHPVQWKPIADQTQGETRGIQETDTILPDDEQDSITALQVAITMIGTDHHPVADHILPTTNTPEDHAPKAWTSHLAGACTHPQAHAVILEGTPHLTCPRAPHRLSIPAEHLTHQPMAHNGDLPSQTLTASANANAPDDAAVDAKQGCRRRI
ncbi:hypothetical protein KC318_g3257 [Hortaea werneckii]|nr:hypothetical protein KC334_g2267 [Hortaea werneckii]KAI7014121.1 hypothetical protein KC355_g4809 [Hortaea werneckii]KAI7671799.1 hypothetical protein KC318_g3257 [Hortaea werneckii]